MKKFFVFIFIISFFILGTFESFGLDQATPQKIKYLDDETEVQTQGIVVVPPGILGLQIFYINGCQIYSYYKDFPDLKIGDKILVKGIISQSRGEKRVKTKTAKDIKILERDLPVIAQKLKIKEINEDLIGNLIQTKGQVIERTGLYVYLDDEMNELAVYIKDYTNINKSKIKEGDELEITGILSKYNGQLRLLPRGEEDILIIKKPLPKKEIINYQLMGSSVSLVDFKKIEPYFIISAIILGIIFIFLNFIIKI